ncbi:MAG TPA: galactose oxidase-like domain-containing protein, partial [Gemmatimonadales bacterium]|nr:galactose oxidase-like domain-containing protein [Gemmatimonadales bacterium]
VAGGAGGSGMVSSSPAGINCTITGGSAGSSGCSATYGSGVSVTLTSTAGSGSYLKAWSGASCDVNGNGIGQNSGTCVVAMSQAQSVVVSFETDATQSVMGTWSSPLAWPAVAIHSHLLPNGVVMTWGRMDHNPVLWDPGNPNVFGSAARPADFFCSGHAFLPDGRLLVTGGHSGTDNLGIKTAYLYDFATNTWTRAPDMQNGRWYPSTTTLANGEMLTMAGSDTAQTGNLIPEVFQTTNGTWRVLTTAQKPLPLYPMAFVAPDGRVFMAGPDQATLYLDTRGTGTWSNGPVSNFGKRDYGSAVMYDGGKILLVGGGGTPTATAEVIDLNAGTGWRALTSTMSVARRQMNATLLADGKVLVTGGSNATGFNVAPTDSKVLGAELWDPATEKFTSLGRMSHYRLYHSTSLLLPDGRVLSVGSGQPAATGLTDDYTAEIFSPPYLFKVDGTPADRPNLDNVPLSVGYGGAITVTTADPTGIAKATWIRLSSVTHSFNQNQRMNVLRITARGTGTITLQAPANANLAPPGHYMLFLVNSSGVPSLGKIVRIF